MHVLPRLTRLSSGMYILCALDSTAFIGVVHQGGLFSRKFYLPPGEDCSFPSIFIFIRCIVRRLGYLPFYLLSAIIIPVKYFEGFALFLRALFVFRDLTFLEGVSKAVS